MNFNGVNLSEWFIVNNIGKMILPPQEVITQNIPGRPGSIYVRKKDGSKVLPVDITFIERKKKDFYRKLQDIAVKLDVEKPAPLIFKHAPNLTYYAVIEGGTELDEVAGIGQGTINFLLPNPYGYEKEEATIVAVAGDVNISIPRTGAGSTSPLIQGSSVPVRPIFEVEFEDSTSDFSITNQTTGQTFRVIRDFQAGDQLICNLRNGKIEVNGLLDLNAWDFTSKRWALHPGDNLISVSPSDVAKVTIKYRLAWK